MRRARWILLSYATLAAGCGAKEPAAEGTIAAAPSARPGAAAALTPTDDDLMRYLVWTRDWKLLTNRHRAELDAVTEQVAARYSLKDTDKVVQDPEFLAMLDRQGKEMKAHHAGLPSGRMADAFQATIEGVGTMVPLPHGYLYVPGRNQELLDHARKRYGDAIVDWVLAREETIVATLSQ
jgi:hypothetical protein